MQNESDENQLYMQEMIDARKRGEKRAERQDLFGNLLEANEEERAEGGAILPENELFSLALLQVSL